MISLLFASVAAVFFPGLITRVKSLMSGRKGPGILQPWKNIALLIRKGMVISTTTSFVFRLAPVVYLATIICAIIILPFPGFTSFFGFPGDFVFLAYLLALGKIFFILGAMDTGSSFEGMGANRESLYSMLVEPAFFILMGTLALVTGHISMQEIFSSFIFTGYHSLIIGGMAVYLLVQIAMVENSRMPVDDPKTHLELTMIHEVMILDHSGFDLALIQTGTILKFSLYGILISNILIPAEASFLAQGGLFLLIMAGFAIVIGIMESFRARKKMNRNPQFIATLGSIAMLIFLLSLLLMNRLIL
jgi:formate hydrogenlyase subunit 4